nr:unnamed protein product [Callosobruchus chinensis]
MNISEEFKMHNSSHTRDNTEISCMQKVVAHKERADKSRMQYLEDKNKEDKDTTIYSSDMEKVIMSPHLDMFKSAIFTHRITVYNESFAPVGKKQKTSSNSAALWHEGIFGRSKDEWISTFYQVLFGKRDTKHIMLWLDNCSAQDKNCSLFSFVLYMIDSEEIVASEIIIKYFEPEHTFMAADSFHHRVELYVKRMGNKLCDFQDFVAAVKNASPRTEAFPMDLKHYYLWEDYSSTYKLSRTQPRPYLQSMVQVVLTRGQKTVKYKNDFSEPEFIELNVLNSKITKTNNFPEPKTQKEVNRISADKKKNIIKNLRGVISKNRLQFW